MDDARARRELGDDAQPKRMVVARYQAILLVDARRARAQELLRELRRRRVIVARAREQAVVARVVADAAAQGRDAPRVVERRKRGQLIAERIVALTLDELERVRQEQADLVGERVAERDVTAARRALK